MRRRTLPRSFYRRDSRGGAPGLLGELPGRRSIDRPSLVARIVEVEAYAGAEDPGSHGYRGETPRTRTMFGRPGHLYVYFTYGMHWCANAVCGEVGESSAVLLRAAAPLEGLDRMRAARGAAAKRDRDLCSGPAKLCQAFGIDGDFDGAGTPPPEVPAVTRRVGLSAGVEHEWRWLVPGDPNVSGPRNVGP